MLWSSRTRSSGESISGLLAGGGDFVGGGVEGGGLFDEPAASALRLTGGWLIPARTFFTRWNSSPFSLPLVGFVDVRNPCISVNKLLRNPHS